MIYQITTIGLPVAFIEAESLKATNGVIELRDTAHALVAAVSIANVLSVVATDTVRTMTAKSSPTIVQPN